MSEAFSWDYKYLKSRNPIYKSFALYYILEDRIPGHKARI